MIQYKGTDWGSALGSGILKGIAIGNQYRQSKAQSDYSNAADAAKAQYDTAMKEAGDDVAKQDAAGAAYNKSLNEAAFNYNKYLGRVNEADAAARRGYQEDFRAQHAQQGAQTQETAAPAKMSQEEFGAQFMAPYNKDHSYYDKSIVDDLNTDTIAKVQGIQYSLGRPGELTISQGGKPVQTVPITDQMRAPFIKNLQDMEYAKYGGSLGQQTAMPAGGAGAQGTKAMALGGALGGGTQDPTTPSGEVAGGETQQQVGRPQAMITADNVPTSYRDRYNTRLSPEDEAAYQAWAKKNGRENDVEDYDMRGAWLEAKQKGVSLEDGRGHFPDTYKKPNHPTFSDQSKYNGAGGAKGGTWSKTEDGRDVFTPNRKLSTEEEKSLKAYFAKNEPNAVLNLSGKAEATVQAKASSIQQARAAVPQRAMRGQPTTVADDAQAILEAIKTGNLPKEMKPFYEFMVKNETRLQDYYTAFARRFGHWPTDYEKDRMLNVAIGAEHARHNKAMEDEAKRTHDMAFAAKMLRQGGAGATEEPELLTVGEEANENGGYPVFNKSKFQVGTVYNVTEKGGKEAYPVVTPPGWTKERTTGLINDLFARFRGFKPSDIRTDPRSMRTLIRIGNEMYDVEGAEEMLASTANEVAKYKGSKAYEQDQKEAVRRQRLRGVTEKSEKERKNAEVRKALYGGDITSQTPWRED